jgi:hypothetical protein
VSTSATERCAHRSHHHPWLRRGRLGEGWRLLPINVTGATAAIAPDIGFRGQIARGFALMSRTLEALAHVQEEIDEPIIQAPVDSTGAGEMYTPASSTLPVYNLGGGQRRPAREVK